MKEKSEPKPLRAALSRANAILKKRADLRSTIERAEGKIRLIESEIPALSDRLADEQAAVALLDPEAPAEAGALTPGALRQNVEVLRLRVIGLKRLLVQTDQELLDAEGDLAAARSADVEAKLGELLPQYVTAVEQFIQVARRVKAFSDALNRPTNLAFDSLAIPDPWNPKAPIIMLREFRRAEGAHPLGFTWEQQVPLDDEALAFIAKNQPINQLLASLNKEAEQIRQQRHLDRQAELTRQRDTEYQPVPSWEIANPLAAEREHRAAEAKKFDVEFVPTQMFPGNPERQAEVEKPSYPGGHANTPTPRVIRSEYLRKTEKPSGEVA